MRLICLNVALFETNNDKLSDFLLKQAPDIICLQEVSERIDQSTKDLYISKHIIDKSTKYLKYFFFSPTWIIKSFFQKNFHKQKEYSIDLGGYMNAGNYIKSKFKIINSQNIYVQNNTPKIINGENWPDEDSKAFQIVDLDLGNSKKLRIINYHGIWTQDKLGNKRTLQACKKICKMGLEKDYPVIIAGDFNLFPDTESIKIFQDKFVSLVDEYNIQTTRPKSNELSSLKRNVVDYIFVSKDVKINSFEVLDSDVSDHLPLILDFKL